MLYRFVVVVGVLCLTLSSAGALPAAVSYTVTDLGTLGSTLSLPIGINSSGQVVGYSNYNSSYYHGFLYSSGTMTDLGTWGGHYSDAYDINDSGQIVGSSTYLGDSGHACLWAAGTTTDLGMLPGDAGSMATAINASGQVVGVSNKGTTYRAFLYSGNTMTDISHGYGYSFAQDINNSGQIVGSVGASQFDASYAFLLNGGTMTNLGRGAAMAINATGQVVGYDGNYHAFRYSNGTMTSLGALGGNSSIPEDINASGQIVGYSAVGTTVHAFLYENGTITDLNTLIDPTSAGGILTYAYGINDSGRIIARVDTSGGATHAVLLTPLPEPSTFALLGISAIGLLVCAWRRRSA
jgi:probable HAF family extracellular repeat protein